MIQRKKFKIAPLPVFALASALAHAGGVIIPNGSDRLKPETNSAWFFGDRPISYCIDAAPNFSFDRGTVKRIFEEVVGNWGRYMARKNVSYLSSRVVYVNSCAGDEDLTLYMGVSTPEVEQAKDAFVNPSAMAVRTAYNVATGRGRGFIWVDKSTSDVAWKDTSYLFGILSHEFGHVLGCSHVTGTIMDENLYIFLSSTPPEQAKRLFRQIDFYLELYYCQECGFAYESEILLTGPEFYTPQGVSALFTQFTNRVVFT